MSDGAQKSETLQIERTRSAERTHAWALAARGEIDADSCGELDRTLDEVLHEGARFVVLDLSDVEFLDSSGLRTVLRAEQQLQASGGELVVRGMSGAVERVLEITGLLERLRG